jgi:hypothetical protein
MRQILIEKYIEPSEKTINESYSIEYWYNEEGYSHSFLNHPAGILYNESEDVEFQIWCKKGTIHRDKGFPAKIWYWFGKKTREEWFIKGVYIKGIDCNI